MQAARLCFFLFICQLGLFAISPGLRAESPSAIPLSDSESLENVLAWEVLLDEISSEAESDQVQKVNDFINSRVRFAEDFQIWGESDYWATPVETLSLGRGDCEDFAIAKYVSLIRLGVPADKLRIVYAKAQIGGSASRISRPHMVLSYSPSPEADPFVLDNLVSSIHPASMRFDLAPIFSFNHKDIRSVSAPAEPKSIDQLSRWKRLWLKLDLQ